MTPTAPPKRPTPADSERGGYPGGTPKGPGIKRPTSTGDTPTTDKAPPKTTRPKNQR